MIHRCFVSGHPASRILSRALFPAAHRTVPPSFTIRCSLTQSAPRRVRATEGWITGRAPCTFSRDMCGKAVHGEEIRPAVTTFSENEELMRETVGRFAKEVLAPKVEPHPMCPFSQTDMGRL